MITRVWRGWTSQANAEDYQHFLLDELFPGFRALTGLLGVDLLRRSDGTEVEFIILTASGR
jgi:hypothetical protein